MTPVQIRVLLEAYVYADKPIYYDGQPMAEADAISYLAQHGLIKPDPDSGVFRITKKGRKVVDQLQSVGPY